MRSKRGLTFTCQSAAPFLRLIMTSFLMIPLWCVSSLCMNSYTKRGVALCGTISWQKFVNAGGIINSMALFKHEYNYAKIFFLSRT